ncbi:MAG: GNAT family acetyltransferase [Rhizobiales bacterium]|nr:GNAT family acetyltransferase [Hyphomicrobiales bacterium]
MPHHQKPASPAIAVEDATDQDIAKILGLWEKCGLIRPWNDALTDIAFARRGPNSALLVARRGDDILASLIVGHDGHRGAVYYVSVDPDHQGAGLGRLIMTAAETWLIEQGVWKLNLLVRKSNSSVIGFYDSLGYGEDDTLPLSKRLQPMPHIRRDPT